MNPEAMTPTERRAAFSLAGIFSLRMLGLFMILPVFSLYAETLGGQTPTPVLIGLAIGIYGLTQALFQIPFGMLSDRIGRKPVIMLGLLIFALGSVVAAMSETITGIIIGRALQGSGAIAAAVMALAADLTREEHRTKAMAVIGMTIGLSFALSLVLGPVLNGVIGVPGIFWLTSMLAILGLLLVKFIVPQAPPIHFHRDTEAVPGYFSVVLRNMQLLRLDAGIFTLHMILTASFVVLPFALRDHAGLDAADHWQLYLPVLLISLVVMVPLVIVAEKYRHLKQVFVTAILLVVVAQLGLSQFYQSIMGIFITMLVFFIAFNVLEALLPSLIVKFTPADKKGTAMGVYSTSQFLGAFCGGIVGGSIYAGYGIAGVFGFCAFAACIWMVLGASMQTPRYLSSFLINVGHVDNERAALLERQLRDQPGVAEVTIVEDEGVAYLKVDSRTVDKTALLAFSGQDDLQQDMADNEAEVGDPVGEQKTVGC